MSVNILNRYTSAVLATMPGANLLAQDFAGLNLTNADLSNVDLTGSNFKGCVCPGSTFQNSNLTGVSFFRGNVEGSDFRGITFDTTTNFLASYFEDVLLDPPYDDVSSWVLPHYFGGQSNCTGTTSGPTTGLPDATIRYYAHFGAGWDSVNWVDLQIDPLTSNHSQEIAFAQAMKAAGFETPILKVGRGATTQSDYAYGTGAQWNALIQPSVIDALNKLNAEYPGRFFRWFGNWDLGEDDARSLGAPQYGVDFLSFLVGMSGLVGQNLWKRFVFTRTASWLAGAKVNSLYTVRYFQTLFGYTILNADDLPGEPDNIHFPASTQDILGGQRWAPAAQALIASQTP